MSVLCVLQDGRNHYLNIKHMHRTKLVRLYLIKRQCKHKTPHKNLPLSKLEKSGSTRKQNLCHISIPFHILVPHSYFLVLRVFYVDKMENCWLFDIWRLCSMKNGPDIVLRRCIVVLTKQYALLAILIFIFVRWDGPNLSDYLNV